MTVLLKGTEKYLLQNCLFYFSELCWGEVMVAYKMPQQRKKGESKRLSRERERVITKARLVLFLCINQHLLLAANFFSHQQKWGEKRRVILVKRDSCFDSNHFNSLAKQRVFIQLYPTDSFFFNFHFKSFSEGHPSFKSCFQLTLNLWIGNAKTNGKFEYRL